MPNKYPPKKSQTKPTAQRNLFFISSVLVLTIALVAAGIYAFFNFSSDEQIPQEEAQAAPLTTASFTSPLSTSSSTTVEPANASDIASFTQEVVELVNQERWNNGQLPPLRIQQNLTTASQWYAEYMAQNNWLSHNEPNGRTPSQRMQDFGYSSSAGFVVGENIAGGYGDPASVVAAWMSSPGHRSNILDADYCEIGVGYASSTNFAYFHSWTQKFGCRNNIHPLVIERESLTTSSRDVDLYIYGQGWANQMRFRNGNGSWSNWESFNPNKNWRLTNGYGSKDVMVEIRNGSGAVRTASDTIDYVNQDSGLLMFANRNGPIYSANLRDGSTTWSPWKNTSGASLDRTVQIMFNNKIVQVVRGNGNWIYTRTSTDGENWSPWSAPNGKAISTPSLIEFNGRLIQTVRGSNNWIYTRTSTDGVNWSSWSEPNGRTVDVPVQTVFKGKLVQIVRGTNNWIYTRTSDDGETWTNWSAPNGRTIDVPSMLEFDGKLVQVVRGNQDWIYTRTSDDGETWTNWSAPNGRTIDMPSQIEFNNELIQTVRGNQNWIYTRKSTDGVNWTNWSAPNGRTFNSPVQVIHNGEILQIVRGGGDGIFTRTSTDGVNWSSWSAPYGWTVTAPSVIKYSL
jgi:uncharacterized protein YkwD